MYEISFWRLHYLKSNLFLQSVLLLVFVNHYWVYDYVSNFSITYRNKKQVNYWMRAYTISIQHIKSKINNRNEFRSRQLRLKLFYKDNQDISKKVMNAEKRHA